MIGSIFHPVFSEEHPVIPHHSTPFQRITQTTHHETAFNAKSHKKKDIINIL
jgi:hypothetical protein